MGKTLKRVGVMALTMLMAAAVFMGCGKKEDATDWAYIEGKGKMTIGITHFAPMNYEDENGQLTGFETEFAKAVCEKLGVEADFKVIEWSAKETELNSKNIDCIWNGMTITDERKANMDISVPYMANKQALVAKNENASKFSTADAIKDKAVVAEKGSAGETVAQEDAFFGGAKYTAVDTQAKGLLEVKSGTADIAVIDYVMSIGSIGEGTDFTDLSIVTGVGFADEQYGIAFRKNSPVSLEKVNGAIQELANDGTLAKIAEKYKLQDLILVKPAQ